MARYPDTCSNTPLSTLQKYRRTHHKNCYEYRPYIPPLRTPESVFYSESPLSPPGTRMSIEIYPCVYIYKYWARYDTVALYLRGFHHYRCDALFSRNHRGSHVQKSHSRRTTALTPETPAISTAINCFRYQNRVILMVWVSLKNDENQTNPHPLGLLLVQKIDWEVFDEHQSKKENE